MKNKDLHDLARLNRVRELKEAIAAGADVDERNEFDCTPLDYAIAEKHSDVVSLLLKHGANATARDSDGSTTLHSAIVHGLMPAAEALLDKSPELVRMADRHGNQPLWTAVFNARGTYDFVRLLLRYNADVHHRNNVGLTPLDMAMRIGDTALAEILRSK